MRVTGKEKAAHGGAVRTGAKACDLNGKGNGAKRKSVSAIGEFRAQRRANKHGAGYTLAWSPRIIAFERG